MGDIDNDGHPDLFVTYYGHNSLYRNLGNGKFEDITAQAGLPVTGTRWGSGCALIDYDRDGRLDIFVANYVDLDLAHVPKPGSSKSCDWKGMAVWCGPHGLPRRRTTRSITTTATARSRTFPRRPAFWRPERLLRPGRGHGGLRQRRLARYLRGLRPDAQPALPQRHDGTFEERGDAAGVAYNADGAAAGRHGNRGGRLRRQRVSGYRQDQFFRRPALALSTTRTAVSSRTFPRWRAWDAINCWDGASRFWMWTKTDGPIWLWPTGTSIPKSTGPPSARTYRQKTLLYRNLGNGRFADITDAAGPGFAPRGPSRGLADRRSGWRRPAGDRDRQHERQAHAAEERRSAAERASRSR